MPGQTVSSQNAETQVASSTTAQTLLAANRQRQGATVYNASTAILYLLLGSGTPSSTNYTVQMAASSYYEAPFSFQGAIQGVWASANGYAYVGELT